MATWADHAIWWHVYPLGFTGAEAAALPAGTPVAHRLGRLENWLDYAVELGCSGLLLGPVFAAETHGYDTVDYFRIDPRLGDEADFDRLVAAAKARGLRIVLDGVFNHAARSFAPRSFEGRSFEGRDFEAPAEWFRRGADGELATFEGHDHLVLLNHHDPAVRQYVVDVMCHWLGKGVDGWRLDVAYAVPPEFWRQVVEAVRQRFPEAWFFGELIHGDYAEYVTSSGLDSATQYELWKAVWSSLNDGNFYELAAALERHNTMLEAFTPQTFVGNHDVTRIASRLADERHLGHALAILFAVGGVPSVYYGDEQAFRGVKEDRAGGDDAIRPAFPDRPDELAAEGWPTYRLHQRLIGVRRRNAWLVRARTAVEHLTNEAVALRSSSGDAEELLVLLNVADEPYRFPLDAAGFRVEVAPESSAGSSGSAESAGSAQPSAGPADPVVVPAHSWVVLAR